MPHLKQLLPLGLLALTSAVSAQSVVYRETFNNTTAGNLGIGAAGWSFRHGLTAVTTGIQTTNTGISSVTGSPVDLGGVNSGSTDVSATGLAFTSLSLSDGDGIFYTNEYTVARSVNEIDTISWFQGNAISGNTFRVVVQIGGAWYASENANSGPTVTSATDFDTLAEERSFTWTTEASAWRNLSFTPGTSLSLGALLSDALPTGDLTGFGLYTNNRSGTLRFDTFAITATAIPEPGSFAALAGLGALGFAAARRRRRA
jgi:hypothetical protein